MPAMPDVPQVVRCAVNQTYGSAKIVNIFHVGYGTATGPISVADLNSLCSTVATAFKTRFLPILTTSLSMTGVVGRDLTSSTAAVGSSGVTGAGGTTGGSDAANLACCVSWQAVLHYRGGHPRTYLGGIPTAARSSNQQFTGTFAGQAAAAGQQFLADINAATIGSHVLTLMSVHYTKPVAPGSPFTLRGIWPITGATCNTRIDTQRRRLGK